MIPDILACPLDSVLFIGLVSNIVLVIVILFTPNERITQILSRCDALSSQTCVHCVAPMSPLFNHSLSTYIAISFIGLMFVLPLPFSVADPGI